MHKAKVGNIIKVTQNGDRNGHSYTKGLLYRVTNVNTYVVAESLDGKWCGNNLVDTEYKVVKKSGYMGKRRKVPKIGDRVMVEHNSNSHSYKIGEVVTLTKNHGGHAVEFYAKRDNGTTGNVIGARDFTAVSNNKRKLLKGSALAVVTYILYVYLKPYIMPHSKAIVDFLKSMAKK